jgi:EAL domain-containing protein (putative c-di-GMP-specific phosphodiesterase class I)
MSFDRDLTANPGRIALCEIMVVIAHKSCIKLMAEGVETAGQRNLLAGVGCDFGQGYLFSRLVCAT